MASGSSKVLQPEKTYIKDTNPVVPDPKVTPSTKFTKKLSSIWSGESTTGSLIRQQSTKLAAAMVELQFAEAEAEFSEEESLSGSTDNT